VTIIKICGLIEINQARAAEAAGADFLGMVFAPSRRQIIPHQAAEMIQAVHHMKTLPFIAGVFVNTPAQEVNFIAETCRLDWVQLSGNENWDYCRQINRPIIKALHISPTCSIETVINTIVAGYKIFPQDKLKILLDTHSKSAFGGTGQTFDWEIAREVSARFPVFIAGGLTPENVGQLVAEINPYGVDVSSGVETNGRKDPEKIKRFIQAVRNLEIKN